MTYRTLLSTAVVAAMLAGCGVPAARPNAPDVQPSPDALVVAVRATEFGFAPATVHIPAGKPVRLELANAGQIEHDVMFRDLPATAFRIPRGQHLHDGSVAAHAGAGRMAWMEFIATTPGTYELFCTVYGHTEAGMHGTLVVE